MKRLQKLLHRTSGLDVLITGLSALNLLGHRRSPVHDLTITGQAGHASLLDMGWTPRRDCTGEPFYTHPSWPRARARVTGLDALQAVEALPLSHLRIAIHADGTVTDRRSQDPWSGPLPRMVTPGDVLSLRADHPLIRTAQQEIQRRGNITSVDLNAGGGLTLCADEGHALAEYVFTPDGRCERVELPF
ncbi:hypothetical protein [Deinococcus ficus]|nr:hypothetical protein [Deinococcus ficus]